MDKIFSKLMKIIYVSKASIRFNSCGEKSQFSLTNFQFEPINFWHDRFAPSQQNSESTAGAVWAEKIYVTVACLTGSPFWHPIHKLEPEWFGPKSIKDCIVEVDFFDESQVLDITVPDLTGKIFQKLRYV